MYCPNLDNFITTQAVCASRNSTTSVNRYCTWRAVALFNWRWYWRWHLCKSFRNFHTVGQFSKSTSHALTSGIFH